MSDEDPKQVWVEAVDKAAEQRRRASEVLALNGDMARDRGDGIRVGRPIVHTGDELYESMCPPADAQPKPDPGPTERIRQDLTDALAGVTALAHDYTALLIAYQSLEKQLRSCRSSGQTWADLAYDMWEMLRHSEALEGQDDWEKQRDAISARLTAVIVKKKIEDQS